MRKIGWLCGLGMALLGCSSSTDVSDKIEAGEYDDFGVDQGGPAIGEDGDPLIAPGDDATSTAAPGEGDGEVLPACGTGTDSCNSDDLGGESCVSLGGTGGTLACDPATCTYDTSMCTGMGSSGGGGSGGGGSGLFGGGGSSSTSGGGGSGIFGGGGGSGSGGGGSGIFGGGGGSGSGGGGSGIFGGGGGSGRGGGGSGRGGGGSGMFGGGGSGSGGGDGDGDGDGDGN